MRPVPSRTSLRSQFGVTSEATKTRAAEILRAIPSMENYLQFVSGAKQVLDVAALELADDGMSKEEIARVLEKGRDNLRKYDTMAVVSWNSLSSLTAGPGTGGFIGTGASAKTPLAKQINDSLRTRIETVGQQAGIYAPGTTGAGPNWSRLNAPVGAGESFLVAAQRWAAEAPKGGLLSELPALPALPSWALPAAATAGVIGLVLLVSRSRSAS